MIRFRKSMKHRALLDAFHGYPTKILNTDKSGNPTSVVVSVPYTQTADDIADLLEASSNFSDNCGWEVKYLWEQGLEGQAVYELTRIDFRLEVPHTPNHLASPEVSADADQLPPESWEYLLRFLPKKVRVSLIGDLREEYAEVSAHHGSKKADRWYRYQVASSILPLFWRWGVVGWFSYHLGRFIH